MSVKQTLQSVLDVIERTYGHDEAGERDDSEPAESAADIVEALCNIEIAVQEAMLGEYKPDTANSLLLKAMLNLLAIAEQGDPADEDERIALEAARAAARSVKAAASEPCPHCKTAEELCEVCGGHGVVPIAAEKPRVLVVVMDGTTETYFNPNEIDVHKVDIDTELDATDRVIHGELPEAFRGLATEADILDDVTFA